VVRRLPGSSERYPIQTGFGWTNGVFVRLARQLQDANRR
jgi:neutral trehalase